MDRLIKRMFMSDGAAGGAGSGSGEGKGGNGGAGAGNAFDFDKFTAGLDEPTRTALSAHIETSTAGLKNALKAERDSNAARLKELGELKAKAEKGSELEQRLTQMEATAREGALQTSFYESAVGAGCTDLKLAWAAAKMDVDRFFKRDNTPDMDALKSAHPTLFAEVKKPNANAGNGTGAGAANDQVPATMRASNALRKSLGIT